MPATATSSASQRALQVLSLELGTTPRFSTFCRRFFQFLPQSQCEGLSASFSMPCCSDWTLGESLAASYCAIPRDYLSDTPLLRAIRFLVSQHGQLGAIPPPPFLSASPLESMRSGGAIPSLKKGYLSDTCAIPHENKAK